MKLTMTMTMFESPGARHIRTPPVPVGAGLHARTGKHRSPWRRSEKSIPGLTNGRDDALMAPDAFFGPVYRHGQALCLSAIVEED
jgi:hypothetical protein